VKLPNPAERVIVGRTDAPWVVKSGERSRPHSKKLVGAGQQADPVISPVDSTKLPAK
jgi:hypothetical protein